MEAQIRNAGATAPPTSDVLAPAVVLPNDQDASGRSFGSDELDNLADVLDSGTLTSTKGTYVKQLELAFGEMLGARYTIACSSGTAAVHAAVAAVDPEPGDEIITTGITDMGALSPILYQGAIPVFADVDPASGNITADTVRERITDRTSAIIVTHLFGGPADVDGIVALARPLGIPVIEDAAQAFLASVDGRNVGMIGDIGCFSLQQGKHITTGEGGLVITSDDHYARRMKLFVNKAWPYGEANPDHEFLAPNYRLSELQGAVAVAQLGRLEDMVKHRRELAGVLTEKLSGAPGISTPEVLPGAVHSYWRYCLRVDNEIIEGGPDTLAGLLKDYDISSAPRYVRKPAFACKVFTEQRTFGESGWPLSLANPDAVDYSPERYPGTTEALSEMLVLPFNERYTLDHIEYLASSIRSAAEKASSQQ
ncbi:MAG: DegT/DnrJ/EryC1/StrS family aminotransferase [Acidimicrobiia bacterium]